MTKWIDALKEYNQGKPWRIPKKGTAEHAEVMLLVNKNKESADTGAEKVEKKVKAKVEKKVEKKVEAKVEKKRRPPVKLLIPELEVNELAEFKVVKKRKPKVVKVISAKSAQIEDTEEEKNVSEEEELDE